MKLFYLFVLVSSYTLSCSLFATQLLDIRPNEVRPQTSAQGTLVENNVSYSLYVDVDPFNPVPPNSRMVRYDARTGEKLEVLIDKDAYVVGPWLLADGSLVVTSTLSRTRFLWVLDKNDFSIVRKVQLPKEVVGFREYLGTANNQHVFRVTGPSEGGYTDDGYVFYDSEFNVTEIKQVSKLGLVGEQAYTTGLGLSLLLGESIFGNFFWRTKTPNPGMLLRMDFTQKAYEKVTDLPYWNGHRGLIIGSVAEGTIQLLDEVNANITSFATDDLRQLDQKKIGFEGGQRYFAGHGFLGERCLYFIKDHKIHVKTTEVTSEGELMLADLEVIPFTTSQGQKLTTITQVDLSMSDDILSFRAWYKENNRFMVYLLKDAKLEAMRSACN